MKRRRACQCQCGQELGWSGKVNRSERLINVVITNKPKALRGLDQKVCSKDGGLRIPPSWPAQLPATAVAES